MIFKGLRKIAILLLIFVFVGLSVGCSENDNNSEKTLSDVANETRLTKEELLQRRAKERMDALISMDWKKAYSYLSPARRKIFPYPVFEKRMNISAILRKSASVEKINCESDACDVSLRLTHVYIGGVVDAMQGQENTSIVHEKWVFDQGNWWFIPE